MPCYGAGMHLGTSTEGEEIMQGRLKKLVCTPELLIHMAQGMYRVVANPLPEDVRVVGMRIENDCVCLYVESQEFPEVCAGMQVPYLSSPLIYKLPDT